MHETAWSGVGRKLAWLRYELHCIGGVWVARKL